MIRSSLFENTDFHMIETNFEIIALICNFEETYSNYSLFVSKIDGYDNKYTEDVFTPCGWMEIVDSNHLNFT